MHAQKLNFLLLCKPQAKVILVVKLLLLHVDAETMQSTRVQALVVGIMNLYHDSGSAEGFFIHSFSLCLSQCARVGGKAKPCIDSQLVTL